MMDSVKASDFQMGECQLFEPCVMPTSLGDTEMIMRDCLMVWEKWDERTEIAKDEDGLLVGIRLLGFASLEQAERGK